jgi:hypothetical protein
MVQQVNVLRMTDDTFERDPIRGYGVQDGAAFSMTDYSTSVCVYAYKDDVPVAKICNDMWRIFQNIDENHLTPDDGRSMMCGDIVEISNASGSTYHMVASIGWKRVVMIDGKMMSVEAIAKL